MRPVNPPVEGDRGDGDTQIASVPHSPKLPPASAVLGIAQRIVARLAKSLHTTIPIHDPRVRLNGFAVEFSAPDTSGRWNYRWPGSRLTGDDMRKLAIIGNSAGLRSNEVLHIAVGVLYEQMRDLILCLLDDHERTGKTLAELLVESGGDGLLPAATPARTHSHQEPSGKDHWPERSHTEQAIFPVSRSWGADPVTAAEPVDAPPPLPAIPSSLVMKNQDSTVASETSEATAELAEEVRQLRAEVRVLWDIIDELRDSMEHAIRNLPDQLPPPLQILSLPSDPTADDFGERINAVPAEQLARLRAELAQPKSAAKPPQPNGHQRRLFS